MHIVRSTELEKEIFDQLRGGMTKETRTGVHLSDLLVPRQRYWAAIDPRPPDNDQIMYWLTGKGHENVFVRVGKFKRGEVGEWNGIKYTPDIFDGFPVEIKTRRRGLADPGQEADRYDHYLRQLLGYAAVTGNKKAWLFVWCLVSSVGYNKTKPELACYVVEYTDEELNNERLRLTLVYGKLLSALDTIVELPHGETRYVPTAHKDLPLCPEWMCGTTRKKIISPPVCTTCGKSFATLSGAEKHSQTKSGSGHVVKDAEIEHVVEQKCAWLGLCRGDEVKWAGAIKPEEEADDQGASDR